MDWIDKSTAGHTDAGAKTTMVENLVKVTSGALESTLGIII
jgi:hypothetical protein